MEKQEGRTENRRQRPGRGQGAMGCSGKQRERVETDEQQGAQGPSAKMNRSHAAKEGEEEHDVCFAGKGELLYHASAEHQHGQAPKGNGVQTGSNR